MDVVTVYWPAQQGISLWVVERSCAGQGKNDASDATRPLTRPVMQSDAEIDASDARLDARNAGYDAKRRRTAQNRVRDGMVQMWAR